MAEHYKITKIDWKKTPSDKMTDEIIRWGKIMGSLRMAPYVEGLGWAGNMGFRENEIIWVTPSGSLMNDIKPGGIIGITKNNGKIVYFGENHKKPTKEWEIYWAIFKERQDIDVILHGHDLFALEAAEQLNRESSKTVALTRSITESGSAEFRDEILEILTKTNSYLIGREHGFFALGKTFDEAGCLALEFKSRANELLVGEDNYQKLLTKYHIG